MNETHRQFIEALNDFLGVYMQQNPDFMPLVERMAHEAREAQRIHRSQQRLSR